MKSVRCASCGKFTPGEYSACLGCGATLAPIAASPLALPEQEPARLEGGRWGTVVGFALLAIVPIALLATGKAPKAEFSPRWTGVSGPEFSRISLALGRAHVLGCGEFYYKLASNGSSLAKVYCTTDGANWEAHLVNLEDLDVIGVDVDERPPASAVGVL